MHVNLHRVLHHDTGLESMPTACETERNYINTEGISSAFEAMNLGSLRTVSKLEEGNV